MIGNNPYTDINLFILTITNIVLEKSNWVCGIICFRLDENHMVRLWYSFLNVYSTTYLTRNNSITKKCHTLHILFCSVIVHWYFAFKVGFGSISFLRYWHWIDSFTFNTLFLILSKGISFSNIYTYLLFYIFNFVTLCISTKAIYTGQLK